MCQSFSKTRISIIILGQIATFSRFNDKIVSKNKLFRSIQEVEDEKDSGMVSFDTASIGSGHNNHYYHANNNNFSSPPSSVHMRSTSMITSLNNNRHPSSSSHSSAASSSTATTVHNSTSNRHSAGFNLGIGSQSRRSSSPSFACIYKPKSTPDLFSSVDKLANQSTEFGDEC